jgi:hypothetical protein
VRVSFPGVRSRVNILVIPRSVSVIAVLSFAGCEILEVLSFAIHSDIEILNGYEACDLHELWIPPTVMAIHHDPFAESAESMLLQTTSFSVF